MKVVTNMNKKILIFSIFSAIFSLLVLSSCASAAVEDKSGTRIKSLSYESLEEEPFYAYNYESFEEKKLSNGIPVIIKKSKNQNSTAVRLVIDSVPLSDSIKKAGLEDITLNLMKKGTAKYSPLFISSLEYTDSTVFTSKVHPDYLEYGITTQKDRLENVVEVFASTYKSPVLSLDEFEKLTAQDQIKSSGLLDQLYGILNEKDSYFAPLYFNSKSNISYKDVSDYHRGLQNASRIRIIASGNLSDEEAESLFKILENNFSSLRQSKYIKKNPRNNVPELDKRLYQVENVSGESVCAMGFAKIPTALSDEYLSYGILSLYLDDLLYSTVKEKLNMAQDAGCGVLLSMANIGLISIYNISLMKNNSDSVIAAVENALSEELIQKKLDSYKRIYVSFIMSSEFNADRTLDQMAMGLVYRNDAKDYISRPFRVYKITAGQVKASYDDFIKNNVCWVINGTMTK